MPDLEDAPFISLKCHVLPLLHLVEVDHFEVQKSKFSNLFQIFVHILQKFRALVGKILLRIFVIL